jgi:hypothetical protein
LRQQAYRALFRPALDADFVAALRAATNGGWALGDRRFKDEIAAAIGWRAAPCPRDGQPKPRKTRLRLVYSDPDSSSVPALLGSPPAFYGTATNSPSRAARKSFDANRP